MSRKPECSIQKKIQVICPQCNGIISLEMFKIVNGEEIICDYCQKKIKINM